MKKDPSRLHGILVITTLLAVATAAFLESGRERDRMTDFEATDPATPNDHRRRIAELEDQLRQSRRKHTQKISAQARKIRTLENRIDSLLQRRMATAPRSSNDNTTVFETQRLPLKRAGRLHDDENEAMLFELEEWLAMDEANADWEESIEFRMLDLFTTVSGLEGNELIHTMCGNSFCRVEFEHDDATAKSRLLAAVARQADWTEGFDEFVQYQIPGDGSVSGNPGSVFFVSRKGFRLPVSDELE
jgi:hypothetical protein